GERYLRTHRGIQGELSSDLRFIPAAWNSRARTSFPALAALARNKEGAVTAVQLVYLNPETGQKAACDLKKQSFGLIKGSYVQIQKGSGAVFVAEGVETALSIREAGVKGDIYAALGVANFRNLGAFMSDRNRPFIICADQDGEGSVSHKAVEKAVTSLTEGGLSVSVIRPDTAQGKTDFNDILRQHGVSAIQQYFRTYPGQTPDLTPQPPALPLSSHWEEEFKRKYLADHPERASSKKTSDKTLTPHVMIARFKFLTEQINTLENKTIVESLTKRRDDLVRSVFQNNAVMSGISLRDKAVAAQISDIASSLNKQQERNQPAPKISRGFDQDR
ncbi:MAG: toprim domain-containing protein, partial [Caedimonas sp.]|nr:toprim domain-containing protein [Caedimonas sp.]